ncbi:MAG TPA: hypothetical protein VKT18_05180, partial [Acidimicrobiales bacterium]|nr:hypothetical protein [Acidimicrobiales bacterium]
MDLAPRALPLETIARPARVLFAWLDDELGPGVAGEGTSVRPDPAAVARASRARQLRAARSPFGGNLDAVRPLPTSLAGRAAALREVDGAPVEVRMVELARLVAVQPYAFTDVDLDLPRGDTDLERLFEVTLPSTGATDVAVGFQRAASRFIVASQNQNLQVLGEFTGPIPDAPQGSLAVGFLVAAPPSWVRVALLADRAVLLDGYHRALALLAAGIDVVPAAVEVVA